MGKRTSPACAEETALPPKMCRNRHCPKLSSTRASLGRLLGQLGFCPGIWGGEQRAGESQNWQEFLPLGEQGMCLCHSHGEICVLCLQLSWRMLGCPGEGLLQGKGERAQQGPANNLNTSGKLHLGNPSEIIHIHNFSLRISHRTNTDLSVPQWLWQAQIWLGTGQGYG